MKNIYLDHNVYIQTLENSKLYDFLKKVNNPKNIKFLYSPAHIEEIYKVKSNINSKNKDKMDKLIKNISEITYNNEALPTLKGIVITEENPLDCYKRVSDNDTTDRVESDSIFRFKQDSENYKKLLKDSNKNKSISTIAFDDIWENTIIKSEIDKLNNNISQIIKNHNNSLDNLILKCIGVDRSLSAGFSFKKGNFDILKNSFTELEFTIEILFRILNFCGYNAEKKEKTSISGTHDVTHAIYATKANYLISTDLKFVNKCKAVYYYLGVPTQVIHTTQDNIENTLNDIIQIQ